MSARPWWQAGLLFTALALLCVAQAQAVAVPATPTYADRAGSSFGRGSTPTYRIPLYKSTTVVLEQGAKRVSVGNPGVADVLVLRARELYVVGKALGATNVVVWDANGKLVTHFDVEVTHDLETLKEKLHELLPGESINVHSAQERLILSGQVSSAVRMDVARELASGFLADCIRAESDVAQAGAAPARAAGDGSCRKGTVVNLLQVGGAHQVMLKVTVAEMARSVVKRLDSNFNFFNFGRLSGGATAGGATFPNALNPEGLLVPSQGQLDGNFSPIGPPVQNYQPNTPTIDATGIFLGYLTGNYFLQAVLDISKRKGMARILSEPTLTTLTGQEAQFVSGGEFPIPVPQGGSSNNTTIEFKEFGVGVRFVPMVLDSGRINLNLKVTVSDLSSDNTVILRSAGTSSQFVIPSLTKRSAASTVELADGQTIGIAGLINDNLRQYVQKLPGLGDIPLLGALFRSQEYVSGQTELVIFVTPHLARPIAPEQVRLPTDNFVPAQDWEFYVMGRLEGKARRPSAAVNRQAPPPARFGHDLD